ncbi:tigger transposable element-derived protein 7-like [Procambarus clarkii]|uniref:tigger transposable element-derived protein 7-like n=1 Tax=Procambarus clarkii TaxID=6728 RepID=UPI00374389FA
MPPEANEDEIHMKCIVTINTSVNTELNKNTAFSPKKSDGSHRTKCAIVGKSANPRALKNFMSRLPVVYYNTKNARFTQIVFEDWFQNHFCKEVIKHQLNEHDIRLANVEAMRLINNDPAHPIAKLTSPDGAIYNLLKQWNELKVTTLKNTWNNILSPIPGENEDEDDYDFEGFDNVIFETLRDAGEEDLQLSDVTEWLDNDADDPGCGELTDDEIIQYVTGNADEDVEE